MGDMSHSYCPRPGSVKAVFETKSEWGVFLSFILLVTKANVQKYSIELYNLLTDALHSNPNILTSVI
jgi:hypothetical protein